ncbi:caspase family protein [Hoeflea sp. BAL378]|uniref:caspase family protein n=1 Tax=Hoeflea sp. BAL378 TaxID=1547437 RepID=UPI00068BC46E|nr:caspase family protein [Hoeflea sp. BAL378]
MSRIVLALVLAVILLAFVAAAPAHAQTGVFQDAGKRVALVVGAAEYEQVTALENPANDARIIAEALGALRFEVIHVKDPTRADFIAARQQFLDRLDGSDIAVFYYAGHAIQIGNINYLIPVDAELGTRDDVAANFIDLTGIVNEMDARAKTKIVVLDACRDNPFEAELAEALAGQPEAETIKRGLAVIKRAGPLEKPLDEGEGFNTYGSIIAFAAAPGTTATDGEGDNSPYTAALAAELAKPGVEVGQMFRAAAANVVRETGGRQQPEYLVRLTDEVYFSRPQPSDCDYFAIAPYNQVGIPGVEFDAIRPARAIPACEEALAAEPNHPRYLHNLGRAYDAAADYARAVEHYRQSSELGYVPAFSTLGVMHINGQGTRQDFAEGVRLLKHAASLGYRLAKVGLRNQDFTVLFGNAEYKALQQALRKAGYYDGPIDGDFGKGSRAALEEFQKAQALSLNGATLETLDRLSLLDIIPHYDLN